MLPLSVFIIAKNEADRIGATIRAIRDLTDDLTVIDSGSTDGTQAVAQERLLPAVQPSEQRADHSGAGSGEGSRRSAIRRADPRSQQPPPPQQR